MKRRIFMAACGAAALAAPLTRGRSVTISPDTGLLRPKALRPGSTVGIVTPGTYVAEPERLALIEPTMKHFKLNVKIGKNVGKRISTYTASLSERLDDLHSMFRDKSVNAVMCLRGGYGAAHLLDQVDYDLIRRNPKIFLGYSDITALHLAIHQQTRLVTFHGPMIVSGFNSYTQKYFNKALFETSPIGMVTNPDGGDVLRPTHVLRTIRAGTATGPLVGGNLTLISTTLGTPYEIDTRGKILFLEDVDEEPYSIDRMLTQLRLAGKFDNVAGIIWGECDNCKPSDYKPSTVLPFSLGEVINNILGRLKVPVLSGLTIGHTSDQATLPLGVLATLDASAKTLEVKEAAVV